MHGFRSPLSALMPRWNKPKEGSARRLSLDSVPELQPDQVPQDDSSQSTENKSIRGRTATMPSEPLQRSRSRSGSRDGSDGEGYNSDASEGRSLLYERFDLPASETLLADFSCAFHEKFLLQGRMYVFQNYVCFACDLCKFLSGAPKTVRIPFSQILDIKKAKTAFVIPNAIQIVAQSPSVFDMNHTETYLFCSFLFRKRAFHTLNKLWYTSKGISTVVDSGSVTKNTSRTSVKQALESAPLFCSGPMCSGPMCGMEENPSSCQSCAFVPKDPKAASTPWLEQGVVFVMVVLVLVFLVLLWEMGSMLLELRAGMRLVETHFDHALFAHKHNSRSRVVSSAFRDDHRNDEFSMKAKTLKIAINDAVQNAKRNPFMAQSAHMVSSSEQNTSALEECVAMWGEGLAQEAHLADNQKMILDSEILSVQVQIAKLKRLRHGYSEQISQLRSALSEMRPYLPSHSGERMS